MTMNKLLMLIVNANGVCYCRTSYSEKRKKDDFLSYFSMESWKKISAKEKSDHRWTDCLICSTKEEHRYLIRNANGRAESIVSNILASKDTSANCARAVAHVNNLNSVFQGKFGEAFSNTISNTLGKDNEAIVRTTLSSVGSALAETTNTAILSHNVSYRTMANMRRDISLIKSDAKRPKYTIKHHHFIFDREAVTDYLGRSENTDCIVWTSLAKLFPVNQYDGKPALNAPQVLKEFALSSGLIENQSLPPRQRRINRCLRVNGLEVPLNKMFPNDQQLKDVTKRQIANGEIDIGSPIVPITLRYRSIGLDGIGVTKDAIMCGRAFSLQRVMDRSILDQEEAELLRAPYADNYNVNDALEELYGKGLPNLLQIIM